MQCRIWCSLVLSAVAQSDQDRDGAAMLQTHRVHQKQRHTLGSCDEVLVTPAEPVESDPPLCEQQNGGDFPGFSEIENVRHVTCSATAGIAEDVTMQMAQTSMTEYHYNNAERNGRHGPFRQINIKSGTSTKFNFSISVPGHQINSNTFRFKMFDMDTGKKAKAQEKFILCGHHAQSAQVEHCGDLVTCRTDNCAAECPDTPDQCLVMTAQSHGVGCDNVKTDLALASDDANTQLLEGISDTELFTTFCKSHKSDFDLAGQTVAEVTDVGHPLQRARTVELLFTDATEFHMTFSTTNGGGGRNMLYQLIASKCMGCSIDIGVPELRVEIPDECNTPPDTGGNVVVDEGDDDDDDEPTTTTTTDNWPNCRLPGVDKSHRRACHFWGEPHFTHVFQNPIETDLAKGARSSKWDGKGWSEINSEFQGTGVYDFAATTDGFSSQVYFCPGGNTGTSVGAAIAMKFGDGTTVSIVRHEKTEGTSGKEQYAKLTGITQDEFYTVRVSSADGNEKTVTLSQLNEVSRYFPSGGSGDRTWMQKTSISDWHPHSKNGNTVSNAAICVGNDPQSALVDVSIPSFPALNVNWDIFFEMAVTVVVDEDKVQQSGICGIENFLGSSAGFKDARPSVESDLLFNEAELQTLHGLCGVSWTGNGQTDGAATAEEVCLAQGRDFGHIETKCEEFFEGKPAAAVWTKACEVEGCAGTPSEWLEEILNDEIDFEVQLEEETTTTPVPTTTVPIIPALAPIVVQDVTVPVGPNVVIEDQTEVENIYTCGGPENAEKESFSAYWEYHNCGHFGNDYNAAMCGGIRSGKCPTEWRAQEGQPYIQFPQLAETKYPGISATLKCKVAVLDHMVESPAFKEGTVFNKVNGQFVYSNAITFTDASCGECHYLWHAQYKCIERAEQ